MTAIGKGVDLDHSHKSEMTFAPAAEIGSTFNCMNQISATTIRQLFLMLLIGGILGVLCWNLYFWIPAVLGAYTIYVLLRGPLFFLTDRWKWPIKLATPVLMLGSFVVIFLPLTWIFGMLRERVIDLFQNSNNLLQNAENVVRNLEAKYQITLLTADNIKSVNGWAVNQVQGIVGATFDGAALMAIVYFMLWFMLTEGKRMERIFFDWLPLRNENVEYVKKQMNDLVWSNALGIPLMALVQGFAGLVVYWLLGIQDPWLWFAVTFIAGMIPIVGAALAYVPLALILLSQGSEGKALFILLYGFLVVGSVDNIARMWLMKKISQTHPLTTLFGVIAGLRLFGFIGFVFGPILISLLILLLRIYHKEFIHKNED